MSFEDYLILFHQLLARWRAVVIFAAIGFLTCASIQFLRKPKFKVSATLSTAASGGGDSRLAAVASQFGIPDLSALRAGGSPLTPDLLAQILRSDAVLRRVLDGRTASASNVDSITVSDFLLRRTLSPAASSREQEKRYRLARRDLLSRLELSKNRLTSTLDFSVTTDDPATTHLIVSSLIAEADALVRSISQEQARNQRQFIEQRLAEQSIAVRNAELQTTDFLERNAEYRTSPRLNFMYGALERNLQLQQQLLVSLRQSADQERIRELRDIPTIVILDKPVLPSLPESRRIILFAFLGGISGGLVGIIVAFRGELKQLLASRSSSAVAANDSSQPLTT